MRTSALLFVGLLALPTDVSLAAPVSPDVCSVTIKSPGAGQMVGPFTPVTGSVSSAAAAAGDGIVVVIIHPDKDWYWVQPVTNVADLQWTSSTQFGLPTTPHGWRYEVRAFVAPTSPLQEGDRLTAYPEAACASDPVYVRRN